MESDEEMKNYLLHGVKQGFQVVDKNAPISSYFCENYKSVLVGESSEYVNNLIIQELLEDKFVLADHEPICVHTLGAVPKKGNGFRPITDCKRPLDISINNYMEEAFQTFAYQSSDDVCELMQPGCSMATVDVVNAYRSVSVNPSDWEYFGISWIFDNERCFLFDTRVCFGLRCAPYLFTRKGEFVKICMARKGIPIIHYIDDFCVYGGSFDECQKALMQLIVLLGRLGFCISWKKCSSTSQECTYLGLVFNSRNMTISLPQDKLRRLYNEIEFFKHRKGATRKQIARLCGVLSHCARVVRGGRTFSRRVLDLLKGLSQGNPRIHLKEEFRLDIAWWVSWAEHFNSSIFLTRYFSGI